MPDSNRSAGHAALPPSHTSSRSHTPRRSRHGEPRSARASRGQTDVRPSQTSAISHAPAARRQTVPNRATTSVQLPRPSHRSARLQADAAPPASQVDPADSKAQLEEQHEASVPFAAPSSHCSPRPTTPSPQPRHSLRTPGEGRPTPYSAVTREPPAPSGQRCIE